MKKKKKKKGLAQLCHSRPRLELAIVRNACEQNKTAVDGKSFHLDMGFQGKLRKEIILPARLYRWSRK